MQRQNQISMAEIHHIRNFEKSTCDPFKYKMGNSIFYRDQARGRLGRNGRPGGRNFALNGTKGEVGVSLKKKKKIFFF